MFCKPLFTICVKLFDINALFLVKLIAMKNLIADMKANRYVAGVRQVNRHLLEKKIKKVYLATDCEKDFEKKVLAHFKNFDVAVEVCGTRQEFAKLCNIEVLCAVIGILN